MLRPRVLLVTRKWSPAVGGMETYSMEIATALGQQTALKVKALKGRANGKPPVAPALLAWGLRTAVALTSSAKRFGAVHIGDLALWPLAWIASIAAPGAHIAVSVHGTDIAYPLRRGLSPMLYGAYLSLGRVLLGGRTVLIANSRATAQLCRKRGFRNVAVAPLAVRASKRPVLLGDAPAPYVLFVGRLVKRKGCAWFVDHVLPLLPEGVTLKVAGPIWDKSEEAALQHPRVEYLGSVFGEELAELRRRAGVVVMPNTALRTGDFTEGFGLSALESARDGGVVLAANLDGLADAVAHGETGYLLPPGEPQAWRDAIAFVAGWSRRERQAFLARAQVILRERYSWDRVARDTLDAYARSPVREQKSARGAPVLTGP